MNYITVRLNFIKIIIITQENSVLFCATHFMSFLISEGCNTLGDRPLPQTRPSPLRRHFCISSLHPLLFAATLRPPPALLAADPFAFRSSLCLFRYPTSSGRRCVQFSSLYIAKLRQAVRSFPSADPASPFARLCDYRLSPIERLAPFRRARFMHRKIRRQAHNRLQCKFNRTDKCTSKNLQRYPYRLRCTYLPFPRLRLFVG